MLRQSGGEQQEGPAAAENTHHGGKQGNIPGKKNGGQSAGRDAQPQKGSVHPGGLLLQLPVGDPLTTADEGGTAGVGAHPALKAAVEVGLVNGTGGAVEGIDHPLPLPGAQYRQLADGSVRGGQGLPQDVHQAGVKGLDFPGGKELGQIVIVHRIAAVVLQIAQVDAQLLQLIAAVVPAAGEADKGVGAFQQLGVLVGEGDVKQPLLIACQLHNLIKGIALMAQHIEPVLVELVVEFVQRPVPGDLAVKGQGADKHAAGLFGGKVHAVKNGDADGKAVGPADALKVDGQRHVEDRERSHPAAHAEGVDVVVQVLGQLKGEPMAHRTDGSAPHGLEHGGLTGLLQHFLPVSLVPAEGGGGEVAVFFLNVVLIAGDGVQVGLPPGQQVQIDLSDAVAYQSLGPAIGDEVVQLYHQPAGIFPGAQQHKAVQGGVQQRHDLTGKGLLPAVNALLTGLGKVIDGYLFPLKGGLILHGSLILKNKTSAQRAVGGQNKVHAALKGGKIHPSLNMESGADVVDGGTRAGPLHIPDVVLAQGEGIQIVRFGYVTQVDDHPSKNGATTPLYLYRFLGKKARENGGEMKVFCRTVTDFSR